MIKSSYRYRKFTTNLLQLIHYNNMTDPTLIISMFLGLGGVVVLINSFADDDDSDNNGGTGKFIYSFEYARAKN